MSSTLKGVASPARIASLVARILVTAIYVVSRVFQITQRVPLLARIVNVQSAFLVAVVRCMSGTFVARNLENCKRPEKLLRLYEFEACPYCRKVRETLSVLDLDVAVYPCPKVSLGVKGGSESSRFRGQIADGGVHRTYPYLVDDNTGEKLQDSSAIIAYLWKTYGSVADPPLTYKLGRIVDRTPLFLLPNLLRPLTTHGVLRVSSKAPSEPLELWGNESSPFVRHVREALCVLEIPYVLRNIAHGSSAKRNQFLKEYGAHLSSSRKKVGSVTGYPIVQIPFLRDPNTGCELLESADIVAYLYRTYQDGPVSDETWLSLTTTGASASKKKD